MRPAPRQLGRNVQDSSIPYVVPMAQCELLNPSSPLLAPSLPPVNIVETLKMPPTQRERLRLNKKARPNTYYNTTPNHNTPNKKTPKNTICGSVSGENAGLFQSLVMGQRRH